MRKISLLLLAVCLAVMTGCASVRAEQPTEPPETQRTETTAPEKLMPGISTIEEISRYYQEKFPDQEIWAELRDLDGNGWEDLAVWYQSAFRALYLMEENYVLGQELLFERGFQLMDYRQDERVCDTNLIGTIEEEGFATIYKYYKVKNGSLYLQDALKYDGTAEHEKCFARSGEEWVPITDEAYRNELGKYYAQSDQLQPIGKLGDQLCTQKEASDVVLKTMEVPLQDGRILTLQVMGKRDEATGNCGVREIIVYEGETVRQSLLMEEAIRADGVDGIAPGYTECFSPEKSTAVKDVNFDGIPDIEVCGWVPNNSIPYYYWCWDAETEQFVYAFCLQLTEVDAQNRQLICRYQGEGGLYYTDHYRVNGHMTLELVDRKMEDASSG